MTSRRPEKDELVDELRDDTWHGRDMGAEIDLNDWCRRREEPEGEREHEWAITASRLNGFWSYIFPRLAAYVWRGSASWPTLGTDARPWLVANIPLLPPTNEAVEFIEADFVGYLASGCATIPIRFMGWGGYDFILSDQGLDLFYPAWGYSESDIFHFFTHRSTGDSAIRLPLFMDQTLPVVDTDSSDGPQQVQLPQAAMNIILECAKCEDLVPPNDREVAKVPFVSFVTLIGRQRWWWLEGSVYRGILLHLPRVVATMWYERQEGCPTHSRSYHKRYSNPGDDRRSLRSIFRERMETWLPSADAMDFEERCGGVPTPFEGCADIETEVCDRASSGWKKTIAAPYWNAKDVMITARGMYFPCLKNQPVPTRQQILTEIEAGRAGNAVFTSTRPCATL